MSAIQELHTGDFLRLLRDGHWEYVARTNSTGAVFIVAITPHQELVLVEQYRVPLRARTIELPAGMIGDEAHLRDETLFDSALRELEEETGYRGRRAELLMSGPVAAGLTSEILHLVRVHDLERVHAGGGVGHEDIQVHVVPLTEIDAWLERQRDAGRLIEPRIYAGLYFVLRAHRPGSG
ncbi:ADP-ribose pyrophosphatase [Fontimonas thermophila]|uniref:ADP-ribose pyrophosphatase n=1 Tax=Fontimonas thermophila TaxID=1076937 RepID=A0A1I2KA04_9GAMM|nr:NUDIX hydrolase [Fontimonas thermophila]SFF63942.1 ADP-ribose pyrophosphatase [Fontimonas thermophila]